LVREAKLNPLLPSPLPSNSKQENTLSHKSKLYLSYYRISKTDWVVRAFLDWLENKPDWWVLVKKKDFKGSFYCYKRDWFYFRVYNRFEKPYVKRVLRVFNSVKVYAESCSFVHFVLTVKRDKPIHYQIKALKENWNRLRALIKKRLGFNPDFFTVLEPHRDGYPHLHVLIFTEKFVISHKELSDWCDKHNLGYVVWLRRYWKNGFRKKPIYYLAKYLSKQYRLDSWSEGQLKFYAYLWFYLRKTKSYSFSCSRRLSFEKKRKWVLVKVGSYNDIIKVIMTMVYGVGWWVFHKPLDVFYLSDKEFMFWEWGSLDV
jgi:hypothetical protein